MGEQPCILRDQLHQGRGGQAAAAGEQGQGDPEVCRMRENVMGGMLY